MNKFWPKKYPHWEHMHLAGEGTFHREIGDIPSITPAQDIFVIEEGHLVLKNPSKPYKQAYT